MSVVTRKATLVEMKKYFCPNESMVEFNEQRKALTDGDRDELLGELGTAIDNGTVVLA